MDGNVDIYCEMAFLKKFVSLCPQYEKGIPKKETISWLAYFDLLCKKSDLVIMDSQSEDFRRSCDKNTIYGQTLSILLESWSDGNGLKFLEQDQRMPESAEKTDEEEKYFNKHKQTIFLLDRDNNLCSSLEEDYGLLFISPESMYEKADFLFSIQRKAINSDTTDWDFLTNYRWPCNSIYLIDNFILGKDKCTLESNIKSLFEALLPLQLNKRSLDVIIITQIPDKQDEAWANRRADKVKQWIRELRSNYSIDVSVKFSRNQNHDRNLITSYFLIDSGYGFILEDKERKKGTKVTIFSIAHPSTLEIMESLKKLI